MSRAVLSDLRVRHNISEGYEPRRRRRSLAASVDAIHIRVALPSPLTKQARSSLSKRSWRLIARSLTHSFTHHSIHSVNSRVILASLCASSGFSPLQEQLCHMGLDGKKLQRHPTPLRRGSVVSQAGDQSLELTDGILVLDAYSVLQHNHF